MSELRDLYQEVILEHGKKPRNFRTMEEGSLHVEGYNPLCGDKFTIFLKMEGDKICYVCFHVHGCAISTASASLMTESLKGKTKAEVDLLFRGFQHLVTDGIVPPDFQLGKLAVFAGVREFPVRVKCATLPWHTLNAALRGQDQPVSTE